MSNGDGKKRSAVGGGLRKVRTEDRMASATGCQTVHEVLRNLVSECWVSWHSLKSRTIARFSGRVANGQASSLQEVRGDQVDPI